MTCFWIAGTFSGGISTGHHHPVRDLEDRFEILDGLRLFELGDYPGLQTERGDAELHVANVLGGAHEGDGDRVHAVLHAELEVRLVLLGQRRHAHRDARQVDALVLAQHAAIDDLALHIFTGNFDHAQLNQAVGKQNPRPRLQVFRKRGKGGRDHRGSAQDIPRGDGQALPGLQLYRDPVLEPAGANLGSLQIAQDADALVLFARDFAHHLDELQLLRQRAVGEIEPGNVEAAANQFAKNGFV